jgi:hypothetical protein
MNKKIVLSFLLVAGLAAGASAQNISNSRRNENVRIAQGVRDGSLTRGEAYRLNREQRDIHRDIRRAKYNDGYISPRERARIKADQRRANRNIYKAKHNSRRHCY